MEGQNKDFGYMNEDQEMATAVLFEPGEQEQGQTNFNTHSLFI
jgi:hypothetical protein